MAILDQALPSPQISEKTDGAEPEVQPENAAGEKTQGDAPGGPGEKAPVPEDHPTKLGRRVSKMEEAMTSFLERFDSFMGKLEENRRSPSLSQTREPADEEVPDHIREAAEYVERRAARKQQAERQAQQRYAGDYLRAVRRGFEDDLEPELHKEIVRELTETNFQAYLKHSGDPENDARINYGLALAAVLKRQRRGAQGKPNVRGDQKTAPTDVSTGTHMGEPLKKEIELDPWATKFLATLDPKEAQALREGLSK